MFESRPLRHYSYKTLCFTAVSAKHNVSSDARAGTKERLFWVVSLRQLRIGQINTANSLKDACRKIN